MRHPPEKTPLEIIFDVPDHVSMNAASEVTDAINNLVQQLYKTRKLDGRVGLSVVRAVTARMYLTLNAKEQAASQQFSQRLVKRLNFLVVPGSVIQ